MNDILVVIPTYNEIHNLSGVVDRILVGAEGVDILIVDDNSPDGTGRLAEELAAASPRIFVLHRRVKSGLGDAYRAGFAWGLDRGYAYFVEMDGDGSHQPEQLPALLAVVTGEHDSSDVALGSRWTRGGSAPHWAFRRRLLSRAGSIYARFALGLRQRDVTGGYRVFSAGALRAMDYSSVESQGYCFQIEMLWRAHEAGLHITEVPIEFVERASGESKMSSAIVLEAITRVTTWGIGNLPNRLRRGQRPRSGALSSGVALTREPLRGRAPLAHRVDGSD